MPKKSKSKGQQWVSVKRSNDDDDRDGRPRVSLKSITKSNKKRIVGFAALSSLLDDDGDVEMLPAANRNKVTKIIGSKGRGRGGYVNNGSRVNEPLCEGHRYKIRIRYGKNLDKTTLIGLLQNAITPDVIVPITYKEYEPDVIFYIDDFKVAKKLLSSDRKITTPDGFKMIIKVTQQREPSKIDEVTRNRIKLAMDKRYVAKKNLLDLSAFHHDCNFEPEYYFPLNRDNILTEVLDIVGAVGTVSETLSALYLNTNNFGNIYKLSILVSKCPNLKILDLSDNKITSLSQLEAVKELELVELKLTGNPVCLRYKYRHDHYVGDLRKIFPKLMKLDGMNLLPPILFGVHDETKLSETVTSFDDSRESYKTGDTFFREYIKYFDSERQILESAYNENAMFSLTISSPPSKMKRFDKYCKDNRDIIRGLKDPIEERRLLKQGKALIISYLSSLPQTKHCLKKYTLDIILATENMITMKTTGTFQELNTKKKFTLFFRRKFIIVRHGAGWCITNDELSLSPSTQDQVENLFKTIVVNAKAQTPSTLRSTVAPELLETLHQHNMVNQFSAETKMNITWSGFCLAEQEWNYKKAIDIFKYLSEHGQIPQEAF